MTKVPFKAFPLTTGFLGLPSLAHLHTHLLQPQWYLPTLFPAPSRPQQPIQLLYKWDLLHLYLNLWFDVSICVRGAIKYLVLLFKLFGHSSDFFSSLSVLGGCQRYSLVLTGH